MEDGIIANYNGTWAARGKATSWDGTITVTGDKGCLVLDAEEKVVMKHTELDYALDMFIRCIEEDKVPESDLEENYRSFSMVCAAEESVRTNLPIPLR